MSDREARPAALRVKVADVAVRASLVSNMPGPPPENESSPPPSRSDVPPEQAVIRQLVRVISDPPPPPMPEGAEVANGTAVSVLPGSPAASEARRPDDDDSEAAAPRSEAKADSPHGEGYAALEVEPLESLDLADDGSYDEGESAADEDDAALDDETALDEDDAALDDESALDEAYEGEEPHVIDMSTPPPPAPLRAAGLEGAEEDSDELLSEEDDDELLSPDLEMREDEEDEEVEVKRPSGEFEELDVDAVAPPDEGQRSLPPPPPPPVNRISMAEPPDLKTLTRTARVQELRPSKPRQHPWWEVFFDDDYLRTVRAPTPEQVARQCDFIQSRMGLKHGATLLDVGCGLGQAVVELTARGFLGVGLDLSLAMLSRASEEAQARGMRINFLHADMREMNFEGAFDALTCLGTTLGYFDDEANRKVIERFHRALKPGGVLLLDVVNRDHVIRYQPNLIWFEGDGCVCMEESEFNFFTSRLHIKRTVILDTGKQVEHEYSLRLYSLHELGQLLHATGFRVAEVSGREALPGVFFGQDSPNLLVVAERRVGGEGGARPEGTSKFHTLPEQ